ncbi:MAG: hypothetical protein LBP75_02950 [Planctomycetota bacterium]|nr:hypothetical protein [Planctomycetota bacterium]
MKLFFQVCFFPLVQVILSLLFVPGLLKKPWMKSVRQWLEGYLFNTKKQFFANDTSIISYSVVPPILLAVLYEIARWLYIDFPMARSVAYPFIFTFYGYELSVMVILKLITKHIETGEEFLLHLIEHIRYLGKHNVKEDVYVITPNINIGVGTQNLNLLINSIKDNREVTLHFMSMSLNRRYVGEYENGNDIDRKLSFFKNSRENESSMLYYLYERYFDEKNSSLGVLDEFVSGIKEMIACGNVKICECPKRFIDNQIVGYLSNKECVMGRYCNVGANNGGVTINAESVHSSEFIDVIRKSLIEENCDERKCVEY